MLSGDSATRRIGIGADPRAYLYVFSLCFLGISQLLFSPAKTSYLGPLDISQHR